MKTHAHAPLLPLAAAASLLFAAPAGDSFELGTKAGQSWTTSFSMSSSMELVEQSMTQNGEDMGDAPEMEQTQSESVELTFVDAIEAAAEGVPTKFTRTFEAISGLNEFNLEVDDGFMDPVNESHELESKLVEETVSFEETEDGWKIQPAEGSEIEAEELAALSIHWSPDFLLPSEDVEEGASWEIPASDAEEFFTLPGDLLVEFDAAEGGFHGMDGVEVEVIEAGAGAEDEADVEGKLVVTHAGTREVDGESFVVLKLQLERTLEVESDGGEMMQIGVEGEGDAPEIESESTILHTEEWEGKGEALWSPSLGRFTSFSIEIDVSTTDEIETTMEMPGMGEFSFGNTTVEEGTRVIEMTTSLAK